MRDIKKITSLLTITVLLFSLTCGLFIHNSYGLPSTFGNTYVAPSGITISADAAAASLFTTGADAEGASLYSLTWYGLATVSANVKALLVDAVTLNVIAVTSVVSVNTTAAWRTCNFSTAVVLEASEEYYLGIIADSSVMIYCNLHSGLSVYDSSNNYTSPASLSGALVNTYDFSIYGYYSGVTVSLTSNPANDAEITINETSYTTPQTLTLGLNNYTFIAEESLVYNNVGYVFYNWIVNSSAYSTDESITLNITAVTSVQANYTSYTAGLFHFYGPFNETSGYLLAENVTVVAHYLGDASYTFILDENWVYPPDYNVQYFEFIFADGSVRYYWVDPSELISSLYIFKPDNLTDYLINFLDYTGILQTYPFVTAKTYVNGSLFTVEKVKVDAQNSIVLHLEIGAKYELTIGNDLSSLIYGDYLCTSSTSSQLILRAVELPKEVTLIYKYMTFYAYRDFSTNSLQFFFNDTLQATNSLTITITDDLGTVSYTGTYIANTVNLNWTSAVNATSYLVSVTVDHEDYGEVEWSQYLTGSSGQSIALFNMSFLGDWSFDLTYLFPAILILCIACCFSALNAEVGAIMVSILAVLLSVAGWIPIPAGSIVAAFSLAILMALVFNKRRGQGQ